MSQERMKDPKTLGEALEVYKKFGFKDNEIVLNAIILVRMHNMHLAELTKEREAKQIILTNIPTAHLQYELKMRKGPDWICSSCGYYADGSGQWACPGCGKWHYFTGSMKWPVDSEKAREWKLKTAKRYGVEVANGPNRQADESGTRT